MIQRIVSGFFFKCMEAADTGSYDNTHAILVDRVLGVDTCVGYGLTGCHNGILGIKVELTKLLAVEVFVTVEVLYLAGELCLELRCVKMGDRTGSADAVLGVLPRGGNIVADGADHSEAGYYDSFKFH